MRHRHFKARFRERGFRADGSLIRVCGGDTDEGATISPESTLTETLVETPVRHLIVHPVACGLVPGAGQLCNARPRELRGKRGGIDADRGCATGRRQSRLRLRRP